MLKELTKLQMGFILFAIVASLSACKTNSFNDSGSASDIQHKLGDTSVERLSPLDNCKNERHKAQQEAIPQTMAYLSSIASYMVARVQATGGKAFQNHLAFENLCFTVNLSSKPIAGEVARAAPNEGLVDFSPKFLLSVKNDAEFAAVLAHELAHVTLGHFVAGGEHTFKETHAKNKLVIDEIRYADYNARLRTTELTKGFQEKVAKLRELASLELGLANEEVQKIEPKLLAVGLLEKLQSKPEACGVCTEVIADEEEFIKLTKFIKEAPDRLKAIYQSENEADLVANKFESDADEVGLEFYARAGFSLKHYSALLPEMLKKSGQSESKCVFQEFEKVKRGLEAHPDACWRLHNNQKEISEHGNQYRMWIKGQGIVNLEDSNKPSLQSVKAELREYLSKVKL